MSAQVGSEGELPQLEGASSDPLESSVGTDASEGVDPLFVGCLLILVYFVVLLFRVFRRRRGDRASMLVSGRMHVAGRMHWRREAPRASNLRVVPVHVVKQFLEEGQGGATFKMDDCKPDDTCPICLEALLGSEDTVRGMPICGHAFHEKCIVDWLVQTDKARCPMCRRASDLPPAPPPPRPRKHTRGHVF